MAESVIRWTRSDYIRLGKAVSNFNKTINEHETLENKLYLPEEIQYKEVKEKITTRRELNRVINSLRRITNENSLDLYETEGGEQITNWERRELRYSKRNSNKKIKCRIKRVKYTT